MRKAFDKFKEIYGSEVGQDVIETLSSAGGIAIGQALFTDMSPEEIAMSATIGIPSAFVGRKVGADVGRYAGRKAANNPKLAEYGDYGITCFMKWHKSVEETKP